MRVALARRAECDALGSPTMLAPSRRVLSLLALAALALPRAAAQVEHDWTIRYRDPALPGADDYVNATAVGSNGDVYVGGFSLLFPVFLSSISKYDSTGTLQWRRVYAPVNVQWLQAHAIPTGGAYFVGRVWSPIYGTYDYVVTRVDAAGNLQWTDTYSTPATSADYAASAVDVSGNVLLVGSLNYFGKVFARSYAPNGSLNFHGQSSAFAYPRLWTNSAALLDGGVVFGVWNLSEIVVCCFSNTGTLAWSHSYVNSMVHCLAVDPATGDVLVGTGTGNGTGDPLLERFDAQGNVLWSDSSMDPAWTGASVYDIAFASDGAMWAAGTVGLAHGWHELVMRYDASGARTATHVGSARGESAAPIVTGDAGQVWVSGVSRVEQFDASGRLDWRIHLSRPSWVGLVGRAGGRLVAAGTISSGANDTDGVVEQLDVRNSPDGYCTAQVNSLGCTPSLTFAGNSSASSTSGFVVSVERLLNQKSGLFFYGTSGVANVPFHGGTLCVAGPLARSALLTTGGSALPANDCSGALAIDFNALASNSSTLAQPGTTVYVQAWSHDPGAPSTANLSGALHFVVLP